jgi:glutaminyl-peptide cyclotransferase
MGKASEAPNCKKTQMRAQQPKHRYAPLVIAVLIIIGVIGGTFIASRFSEKDPVNNRVRSDWTLQEIPFDGSDAMKHLETLCDLGRRPSGSQGMTDQQDLITQHFEECGGLVHRQTFTASDPRDGTPVPMTNLIAQWAPDRTDRILLCAHYDTLPYPMLDPEDPEGEFVGANDGASGVAILMTLARELSELTTSRQTQFGVDLVLFDGEEYIFNESQKYFIGSEHFARSYRDGLLPYKGRYECGVLLDMVGDADLQLPKEKNSLKLRQSRLLTESIWETAHRLEVWEFTSGEGPEIRDDHLMLQVEGGIPACDVIDFDYPVWHTREDTPEQCSALSLAKVGWVVLEWLAEMQPLDDID